MHKNHVSLRHSEGQYAVSLRKVTSEYTPRPLEFDVITYIVWQFKP
jgi:hypothetical protein